MSDPTARALLAFLCRGCSPQDSVFRLSLKGLASALVKAAAAFGYRSSDLLPCSLRRGGATFHFARCGRWALATTARKFISQAACDTRALSLLVEGRHPLWLLVSPGVFLSPLLSCVAFARSCSLACAARLLSFTSFLPLLSCFQSRNCALVLWFSRSVVRQVT